MTTDKSTPMTFEQFMTEEEFSGGTLISGEEQLEAHNEYLMRFETEHDSI